MKVKDTDLRKTADIAACIIADQYPTMTNPRLMIIKAIDDGILNGANNTYNMIVWGRLTSHLNRKNA